ncbi:MAG: hypothetical protein ACTSYL_01690 [Candidatus Thorarchaeota archaeon]
MPVPEKFKEKIRRRVEKWRAKVLAKYPPEGDFEEIDLGRFTIFIQSYANTGSALPRALMKLNLVRTPGLPNPQLALLTYPTVWDAATKDEMLTHREEFAIYDRTGLRFTALIPHYIMCGCFGDRAIHIRTSAGEDYYVDNYGCRNTLQYAPPLDFLEKRPELVVRDSRGVRWATERIGDRQLSIKNPRGDMVIYAKQIPVWKRLFPFPSFLLPRLLKLDVSVYEEVPKEVILFLAARTL